MLNITGLSTIMNLLSHGPDRAKQRPAVRLAFWKIKSDIRAANFPSPCILNLVPMQSPPLHPVSPLSEPSSAISIM